MHGTTTTKNYDRTLGEQVLRKADGKWNSVVEESDKYWIWELALSYL
jgi:hypothetical protein